MWVISSGEEISCFSDDCIRLSILSKSCPSSGKAFVEIAPKFRYLLRVAELPLEEFQMHASRMLLTHNILVLPEQLREGCVHASVVLSFNFRIVKLINGEVGAQLCEQHRADPCKKSSWSSRPHRIGPDQRSNSSSWRFQHHTTKQGAIADDDDPDAKSGAPSSSS